MVVKQELDMEAAGSQACVPSHTECPTETGSRVSSPFVHRFRTARNAHILDVNTGEIVRVDDVVWEIVADSYANKADVIAKHRNRFTPEQIAAAYGEIAEARDRDGLFLNFRPEIRMPHDKPAAMRLLDSCREQLILNVTERCSFRCTYCAFTRKDTTWRNHSGRDMSWETARAAIDEFLEHCVVYELGSDPAPGFASGTSSEPDERIPPAISYYGGEPLLAFPLIEKCTEYVLERTKGKRVAFSLSTNGYALKGDVADFLATHGFYVRVSLDGPAAIHDKHRRTADGLPTWATVVENLKAYIKNYPDQHPNIAVTIPRTENVLEVQRFFAEADWIPEDVTVSPGVESEPDPGYFDSIGYPKEEPPDMEKSWEEYCMRLIDGWGVSKPQDTGFVFQGSLFEGMLRILHRRRRACSHPEHRHLPEQSAAFTTCLAGARRTFVSVDGHYYLCERIPQCEDYRIGSVSTGIDLEKVYMLAKYFTECTREQCRNCWCLPICQVGCYSAIRDGTRFSTAQKEQRCIEHRQYMHDNLVSYCEILERNPHALDHTSVDYRLLKVHRDSQEWKKREWMGRQATPPSDQMEAGDNGPQSGGYVSEGADG